MLLIRAQEPTTVEDLLEHANCVFFGANHDRLAAAGRKAQQTRQRGAEPSPLGQLTIAVSTELEIVPGGSRTNSFQQLDQPGSIDDHLFGAMSDAGVTPAESTTDYEFIRRASLDLTGRIPTPERVLSFVADAAADKRSKLVDELLAKPEWLDKWTMFFGDLLKNNSQNTQIRRSVEGVVAFNTSIRASLAANKPYDQMTRELIAAQGTNSFVQGDINFLVGGVVTGGPLQDIADQQAAEIAETFLGIAHLNCILCHNGRGHLDTLSLWGSGATRYEAWQFASHLARTEAVRVPVTAGVPNPYYWRLAENTARTNSDYRLNTTTGNRPARAPVGGLTTVAPRYPFTGSVPAPGENYRTALGRSLTADSQFARASVNYVWAAFFGRGIVDPPNQFDPARLDPDNPPPAPWTLQPSNPRLLNTLAQDFINSNYDIKALMRQIANSKAYQLSSRYNGTWNPAWEDLFARKFVRRLWSEEIHDALAQSSNILPSYNLNVAGPKTWAMQFPEPFNTPNRGGTITTFLDAFLRGNRDDEERRPDGSIAQALGMMNDNYVMSRVRSTGAATSLLVRNLALPDAQLVDTLFLTVLSRYPTAAEKSAALANLALAGGRSREAENLLWSLYNKVDFLFNY